MTDKASFLVKKSFWLKFVRVLPMIRISDEGGGVC